MKKKILALVMAAVMTLSIGTVALADNGHKGGNGKDRTNTLIKDLMKKGTNANTQLEIKKLEKKIETVNKQIKQWTALKAQIEKKIANNGQQAQFATGDVVRVNLYTRQTNDLDAWYKATIATPGLTSEQIADINKLYTSEKKLISGKLDRVQNGNTKLAEGLQNALAQAIKKLETLNAELAKLTKDLADLKAKLGTITPTVTPTAPTVTPVVTPTVNP